MGASDSGAQCLRRVSDNIIPWEKNSPHIHYVGLDLRLHQWHRNRGFRRFNEPGPPSSWGPRVVTLEPQKNFRQDLGKSLKLLQPCPQDFKAKMHQIRFRLELCPRPRWGSLQRSPGPQLDLGDRFAAEGGAGLGRERIGEGEGVEVEGREREGPQVTVEPGPLRALLRHWSPQSAFSF